MIRRDTLQLSLFLFICIAWAACQRISEPCFQPLNVTVGIGTYKAADTGTAGVDSILPKAVIRIPDSNFILYNGVNQSKFSLVLSPKADSLRYYISTDSSFAGSDTVVFYYSRNLTFLSKACGYTYHYTINNVKTTHFNIDSVQIKNGNVDGTANVEHVKIFY